MNMNTKQILITALIIAAPLHSAPKKIAQRKNTKSTQLSYKQIALSAAVTVLVSKSLDNGIKSATALYHDTSTANPIMPHIQQPICTVPDYQIPLTLQQQCAPHEEINMLKQEIANLKRQHNLLQRNIGKIEIPSEKEAIKSVYTLRATPLFAKKGFAGLTPDCVQMDLEEEKINPMQTEEGSVLNQMLAIATAISTYMIALCRASRS